MWVSPLEQRLARSEYTECWHYDGAQGTGRQPPSHFFRSRHLTLLGEAVTAPALPPEIYSCPHIPPSLAKAHRVEI